MTIRAKQQRKQRAATAKIRAADPFSAWNFARFKKCIDAIVSNIKRHTPALDCADSTSEAKIGSAAL